MIRATRKSDDAATEETSDTGLVQAVEDKFRPELEGLTEAMKSLADEAKEASESSADDAADRVKATTAKIEEIDERVKSLTADRDRELLSAQVESMSATEKSLRDMIAAGLVQEVEELLRRGYDQNSPGMNATGYIELIPYLRGQVDLESAIDAIQRATRRYARRQHTWFRHQLPAGAHTLDARQPINQLVQTIMDVWKGNQ